MSLDIRLERHLDVTPEVAFHHWVDAAERVSWYAGDEVGWIVDAVTDLREGGRYRVRWGPTLEDAYEEEGEFFVVRRPSRLEYSSRFTPRVGDPASAFEVRVTVTFDPEGDGTRLRLVESGYPSAAVRDEMLRDGSAQGLDFYERTLVRPG